MHTTINQYKSSEIKISENEALVKRLNEQILQLRGDNEGWQGRLRESENKFRELENHLFANNQEKEKLSSLIKTKASEYESLRSRYS